MRDHRPAERYAQIGVFTYDGDTPQDARRTIRARAHIVLSNPDMVHSGILPHHPRWAKLFENLRYVIIDELHAYRGVFGSHLCNVLRRLRRICRHYGSNPRLPVLVGDYCQPARARRTADRAARSSWWSKSGAPRGEKFFVFVNPPVVNHQLGIRRSYLERDAADRLGIPQAQPAADRLRAEPAVDRNPDDLSEGRFRRRARRARADSGISRRLPAEPPAGDREGLREGTVRAVVSTNALELGIDIGALDVAVMAGYPGTIAATWQRAGRAGRRASRSAAVMVASSAPLDQFVVRIPSYFFDALARSAR